VHRDYFPPGKGWKYSNTNYVLAGMIIQQVTGRPVSDVMNHYLHGGVRLNLLNTYYLPGMYSNAFLNRMAHGYNSEGMDVTDDNMSWAYTAGAIVTTTQDLLSWWRDLFQGNLLPQAQMDEMMSLVCEGDSPTCTAGQPMPHLADGDIDKGYGLGIIQNSFGSQNIGTVWWHNGSTAGYKAIVMWFPKSDIYMALTINRDPGYLLKPGLPIIHNVLNVLIPDAEWHLAHPKPVHHLLYHKLNKKTATTKIIKKTTKSKHRSHKHTTTVVAKQNT
jgi:CubicO group peptidase (beta-lactamase class C family)